MDSFSKAAWSATVFCIALLRAVSADEPEPDFQVEAYRASEFPPAGTTFRLVPAHRPGAPAPHPETATAVRHALAVHGWIEAPSQTRPEFEVSVDFEVTERVEPASRFSRRFRPVTHRVRTVEVTVHDEEGRLTRVRQPVAVPTNDGYVASTSRTLVTRFSKRLVFSVRATALESAPARGRELCRIVVTNSDESADAGTYARLMVAAATDSLTQPAGARARVPGSALRSETIRTSTAR